MFSRGHGCEWGYKIPNINYFSTYYFSILVTWRNEFVQSITWKIHYMGKLRRVSLLKELEISVNLFEISEIGHPLLKCWIFLKKRIMNQIFLSYEHFYSKWMKLVEYTLINHMVSWWWLVLQFWVELGLKLKITKKHHNLTFSEHYNPFLVAHIILISFLDQTTIFFDCLCYFNFLFS